MKHLLSRTRSFAIHGFAFWSDVVCQWRPEHTLRAVDTLIFLRLFNPPLLSDQSIPKSPRSWTMWSIGSYTQHLHLFCSGLFVATNNQLTFDPHSRRLLIPWLCTPQWGRIDEVATRAVSPIYLQTTSMEFHFPLSLPIFMGDTSGRLCLLGLQYSNLTSL